ncbi:antibiotic biosynthesis monooxygenase [Zhihengliuella sp.]|uniref:putative quinol monooxygenase n=1 Tax=Zhihengliuella sp. TaxID=1954483 RepID=UPI0028124EAB|nr:antibiotic biosynthesis monooxygenase [Zhihengliuella sp.]
MSFVTVGTLEAQPGKRDQLIDILTRHRPELVDAGCLTYDVGVSDDHSSTVFVIEQWTSEEAHREALERTSIRSAISEAMPLLTGNRGGFKFRIIGSPL